VQLKTTLWLAKAEPANAIQSAKPRTNLLMSPSAESLRLKVGQYLSIVSLDLQLSGIMRNTLQAGFQISTYLDFSKNIGLRQKQFSH
jgi:hypothetical protein